MLQNLSNMTTFVFMYHQREIMTAFTFRDAHESNLEPNPPVVSVAIWLVRSCSLGVSQRIMYGWSRYGTPWHVGCPCPTQTLRALRSRRRTWTISSRLWVVKRTLWGLEMICSQGVTCLLLNWTMLLSQKRTKSWQEVFAFTCGGVSIMWGETLRSMEYLTWWQAAQQSARSIG